MAYKIKVPYDSTDELQKIKPENWLNRQRENGVTS